MATGLTLVTRLVVASTVATALISLPVTPAAARNPTVGSVVRVAVSVSTLWVSPDSPRPVDRPALQNPVHIKRWLAAMSTDVRRGLVGRVETQALYGERLEVTGVDGGWLHVVALRQSTHRNPRGYPGWVPARQVTSASSGTGQRVATVVTLVTRLHPTDATAGLTVSFGTRLPVVSASTEAVTVRALDGRRMIVDNDDVKVADSGAALPTSRRSVMRTARSFLGVPYLWGGRSGFAVDCSGFTALVYDAHGVRLPRDADDQYAAGTPVNTSDARPGDLAFFTRASTIGHVGFVARNGRLLHAPGSGTSVRTARLRDVAGFAGYRRFL